MHVLAQHVHLKLIMKIKPQHRYLVPLFSGNLLIFLSGLALGPGWLISALLSLFLLGYLAFLASKSHPLGAAFAVSFSIAYCPTVNVASFPSFRI